MCGKMEEKSEEEKEQQIQHLRKVLESIFSNLGRIVMDVTRPINDIDKIKLFKAVDFQITLAKNLLDNIKEYPRLSKEEKQQIEDLKKKIDSAVEVAKEVEKEELEEV